MSKHLKLKKKDSNIYLRFQLCKSDQHPGVAFILTMQAQWHIGEYSGINVDEPGEVVTIQVRVTFLLQVHQI